MEIFTMVILACVAGEPTCSHARVSEPSFTTLDACKSRMDAIASAMTKRFGERPELKGRQVVYDVSCLDRAQLRDMLGTDSADI